MLDNLQFAWPWAALMLLLPLLVIVLLPRAGELKGTALRVPFFHLVTIAPGAQTKPKWRLWYALVIWLLLIIAACRPQWLEAPLSLPVSGRDLMLAVDLSASMDKVDMVYGSNARSRIRMVKEVAAAFIERRIGDRVGLILFGSKAYLQTPLTFDRQTVQVLLKEANTTLAGPSTAIGDAIGLAIKRLQQRPADDQVIILLTDGESNIGIDPLQAAGRAREAGIRIYTIGVGSLNTQQESSLDEVSLLAIARLTQGQYFRAADGEALERIYQLLDELEPAVAEEAVFRARSDLFHWPLGSALVLLTAALLPMAVRGFRY